MQFADGTLDNESGSEDVLPRNTQSSFGVFRSIVWPAQKADRKHRNLKESAKRRARVCRSAAGRDSACTGFESAMKTKFNY